MKNRIKQFFGELIIIVIGVCIGMMLNSWNQKRLDRNQANLYLNGIVEELEENSKNVEASLLHHKKLYEQLQANDENVNMVLSPALLRDVAWELSKTSIFKGNIDQGLYLNIAKIYSIQRELEETGDQATDRMSEINIIGPYYLLSTLEKDLSEEEVNFINSAMRDGWKAVLESWISYEEKFIEEVTGVLMEIKKEST